MSMMPEDQPTSYEGEPGDAQPQSLQDLLNAALAMMFRDGVLDQDEQRAIGAFFAAVQAKIQQQQAQGMPQPGGDPGTSQTPFQPGRFGPPPANVEDYGSGAGTPMNQ